MSIEPMMAGVSAGIRVRRDSREDAAARRAARTGIA